VLAAVIRRYAARLEHHARQAPYNWFNFYDFWERSDAHADAGQSEPAQARDADGGIAGDDAAGQHGRVVRRA
jgi:hypothetical protein